MELRNLLPAVFERGNFYVIRGQYLLLEKKCALS